MLFLIVSVCVRENKNKIKNTRICALVKKHIHRHDMLPHPGIPVCEHTSKWATCRGSKRPGARVHIHCFTPTKRGRAHSHFILKKLSHRHVPSATGQHHSHESHSGRHQHSLPKLSNPRHTAIPVNPTSSFPININKKNTNNCICYSCASLAHAEHPFAA